ncbi:CBS domain-containing protein [Desulfofundulus luciae]|uniref:CBS domain-containing protein n=1 Tax=Desulfofundulus luciae TaxID=74702 RepID=A0ABU0B1Z6_9FIRM|nr:CBS domain-containing protein [Desulfofundulus luciae]MDQ0286756.1 CBS domain-containing protein [Desulfofundulus luciae]
MLSLKAREIMIPIEQFTTITADATLHEGIQALRQSFHREGRPWHGHRILIVLDENGNLEGILTLRGILTAVGLYELLRDPLFKSESWSWYFLRKLREGSRMRVRDIMRPVPVATVQADDELLDIVRAFLRHNVNSLPVLDRGRLLGVVRTVDVFKVLSDYYLELEEENS